MAGKREGGYRSRLHVAPPKNSPIMRMKANPGDTPGELAMAFGASRFVKSPRPPRFVGDSARSRSINLETARHMVDDGLAKNVKEALRYLGNWDSSEYVCDRCGRGFKLWVTDYRIWNKLPKQWRRTSLCTRCFRDLTPAKGTRTVPTGR